MFSFLKKKKIYDEILKLDKPRYKRFFYYSLYAFVDLEIFIIKKIIKLPILTQTRTKKGK